MLLAVPDMAKLPVPGRACLSIFANSPGSTSPHLARPMNSHISTRVLSLNVL